MVCAGGEEGRLADFLFLGGLGHGPCVMGRREGNPCFNLSRRGGSVTKGLIVLKKVEDLWRSMSYKCPTWHPIVR